MPINYPTILDDLNDPMDWRDEKLLQLNSEGTQTRDQFGVTDISKHAHIDLLRLLQALAQAQASIYPRALKECDIFFEWHNRKKKEANATGDYSSLNKLRPRVKLNKKYGTVEMSWARLVPKFLPNKPCHVYRSELGQTGHYHKTQNGSTLALNFDYIAKGNRGDKYPASTFKDEPEWARRLELELEEKFSALRKEQMGYSTIRKTIAAIHRAQLKLLNEFTADELREWGIEKTDLVFSYDE